MLFWKGNVICKQKHKDWGGNIVELRVFLLGRLKGMCFKSGGGNKYIRPNMSGDGKKRAGWKYADIVLGHKTALTSSRIPPISPTTPPVPMIPDRRDARVYVRTLCQDCMGTGYMLPQKTCTGLEYCKGCRNCNGRGSWYRLTKQ